MTWHDEIELLMYLIYKRKTLEKMTEAMEEFIESMEDEG